MPYCASALSVYEHHMFMTVCCQNQEQQNQHQMKTLTTTISYPNPVILTLGPILILCFDCPGVVGTSFDGKPFMITGHKITHQELLHDQIQHYVSLQHHVQFAHDRHAECVHDRQW